MSDFFRTLMLRRSRLFSKGNFCTFGGCRIGKCGVSGQQQSNPAIRLSQYRCSICAGLFISDQEMKERIK